MSVSFFILLLLLLFSTSHDTRHVETSFYAIPTSSRSAADEPADADRLDVSSQVEK